MKATIEQLTPDQQQLLKDTINYGFWGDCDYEFLDENGNQETVSCNGYCTNDAKRGGHFSGRQISNMFRSIYRKLCPTRLGRVISHCSDWWGDGSGDMLFIRQEFINDFEEWAKE